MTSFQQPLLHSPVCPSLPGGQELYFEFFTVEQESEMGLILIKVGNMGHAL